MGTEEMRQPIRFRLFCLTITTPNLDRTVAWYCEKLGYQVHTRKDLPEVGARIAVLNAGDFRLEIVEQKEDSPLGMPGHEQPTESSERTSRFAVLVDDLEATIAELRDKDVTTLSSKQVDPDLKLSFQFIKDCDGNLIQLVELMPEARGHFGPGRWASA
jgi:catechol 2,3-dioxygenase-like lactoylglutathione lyase family enzyme